LECGGPVVNRSHARAPDFGTLYNDIQYKQWNRPSIPRQYLADPPAGVLDTKEPGGEANPHKKVPAAAARGKKNNDPPDRLRNITFDEEVLCPLGVRIGRVALFLKKIAPAGKHSAVPPKLANGAIQCLNWHTKGHCWTHCDHKKSHVELRAAEKMELVDFLEKGLAQIE
jgi:hypothetical protein